jgi:hypothetical protein
MEEPMARNLEHDIDRLARGLDELRRSFTGFSGRASGAASDAADIVSSRVRGGAAGLQHEIENRPLTSIALAFLAGLLIGRFTPR